MVLADSHTWGDKFENGFEGFFNFIPNLLGALAVLVIGYIVAKLIASVIARLLYRGGLDRTLQAGQGGRWISRLTASPSHLLGRLAFWALFLGAVSLAVSVLGIEALSDFVAAIFGYLPNVVAALLIFLVAGAIAAGVATLVSRTMGDTATGRVVGSVAPILIMAIAGFMILDQLKIAEDIVRITYMALMGAIALGLALAFGLGGRDVAARILEGAYQRGQESKDQVKRDLQQGRDRAKDAAAETLGGIEGDTLAGPPAQKPAAEPVSAGATTAPPPAAGTPPGWVDVPATAPPPGTGAGTPAGTPPSGGKVERVGPDEPDRVPPGSAEEIPPGEAPLR